MKTLLFVVLLSLPASLMADTSCVPKDAFKDINFEWPKEVVAGTCLKETTRWSMDYVLPELVLEGQTSGGYFRATWGIAERMRGESLSWQIDTLQVTGKTYKMNETRLLEASHAYRHIKDYYLNVYNKHLVKEAREAQKAKYPKIKQFH